MAVKTRAQIKSENASDFPDNVARLISPADLRGQMDDVVDSAVFPEDGIGAAGDIRFVSSIAAMQALTGLAPGSIVFVGSRMDQFIVVDDATLGTDGGTVFIPDSELSAATTATIPPTYFQGATGVNWNREFDLGHTGIDLASVVLTLTDPNADFPVTGETCTGWQLHGHGMGMVTERIAAPQFPMIDVARGKFRDTGGWLTFQGTTRTGGTLVSFKYALSGLRLRRVITGGRFDLRWWPVVSRLEETGTQIDNGNYIRWAAIAAAAAKADELYFHDIYHYSGTIEVPDGVAFVGRSMDLSGIRLMDNMIYYELLLSTAKPGHNPANYPLYNHRLQFDQLTANNLACTPTIFPATGAKSLTWRNFKLDTNLENNNIWDNPSLYAMAYNESAQYALNSTVGGGLACSNAQGRAIPPYQMVYLHNVEITGSGGNTLLGVPTGGSTVNAGPSYCISTGLLKLGPAMHNHIIYLMDGHYEHLETYGMTNGEGLRSRNMYIGYWKDRPYRAPASMYANGTTSQFNPTRTQYRMSYVHHQPQAEGPDFPGPEGPPNKLVIGYLDADYSGMDGAPGEPTTNVIPFLLSGENCHVKAGHIRYSMNNTGATLIWPIGNGLERGPWKNLSMKLAVETQNRGGFSIFAGTSSTSGFYNSADLDITVEPLQASSVPENASPAGVSVLIGGIQVLETDTTGQQLDFSAAVAANLAGDWIDLTTPDVGALPVRVWFNYNATGGGPSGTGVTLIPVAVAVGATPAVIAAAFSAAIRANATAYALLVAATFNDKVVIGPFNFYRKYPDNQVTIDVANVSGVTAGTRPYRRNFEPDKVNFKLRAPDPIYQSLVDITLGPDRDLTFAFKDSILGAYGLACPRIGTSGNITSPLVTAAMDRVHFVFEDTTLDIRDTTGSGWANTDLMLYAGKFRNCRVRTTNPATGLTTLGTGYEELYSEQSGTFTITGDATTTVFNALQTKLFWVPKPGNLRLYALNAAAAATMNTLWPSWWRKGWVGTQITDANYYSVVEDRRAPALKLNFSTAPAAGSLQFGWSVAVSP